ncbi:hypothetical protein Rcae01_00016 [Novipirellula caenicola]|uniref:Uncharacterized protein n=1 Tax=Novipirellula caenicola TaxID=1536901 RepID=A0ABP9VLL8_9BACT
MVTWQRPKISVHENTSPPIGCTASVLAIGLCGGRIASRTWINEPQDSDRSGLEQQMTPMNPKRSDFAS